jgi:hypothetical protein
MKTTITKTELKKIHTVACDSWKSKIEKFTLRNAFGEDIKFSEKEIQEMISASDEKQLKVVEGVFKIKDITQEVKSLEDAVNKLGDKDEEVIQLRKLESIEGLAEHILNNQIAVVIVKALNDGWVCKWDDSAEYKYYPWFYLGNNFRYYFDDSWTTDSFASARLCLKSSKLATYAGTQFTEVYRKFMN